MPTIRENYRNLVENIETIKSKLRITYPVKIVAVSKTRPPEDIREVVFAGGNCIGENRVQEAEDKFALLTDVTFEKHLIGHLQSNKANKAAELFDWIQSVDTVDLAEKLNKKAGELGKRLPVLIEVKTSHEESKHGVSSDMVEELTGAVSSLSYLELKGFMTIAPNTREERTVRKSFKECYDIYVRMQTVYRDLHLTTLSMGMSDDYEWAISEGSNLIRPGRVIFGDRG